MAICLAIRVSYGRPDLRILAGAVARDKIERDALPIMRAPYAWALSAAISWR